jgi:hypothetical protein
MHIFVYLIANPSKISTALLIKFGNINDNKKTHFLTSHMQDKLLLISPISQIKVPFNFLLVL